MKGGAGRPLFHVESPAAANAFGDQPKAQADRGRSPRSDEKTEGKTALIDALRKL